jgi:hypothetical protein
MGFAGLGASLNVFTQPRPIADMTVAGSAANNGSRGAAPGASRWLEPIEEILCACSNQCAHHRHASYKVSEIKCKRIEEPFGWTKIVGVTR